MLIVRHRINTPQELAATPVHYGVEIDIHAYGDRLVVHHDPFTDAVDFDVWLEGYRHALLILNIKEEGIEPRVMECVERRGIKDWFLLDVSAPVLYRLAMRGEKRVAARVSAFESVETALALAGKVAWVFIDVIDEAKVFPLGKEQYLALKKAGFKLCLVSHDVWKRDEKTTRALGEFLRREGYGMDAVLTKRPDWWDA